MLSGGLWQYRERVSSIPQMQEQLSKARMMLLAIGEVGWVEVFRERRRWVSLSDESVRTSHPAGLVGRVRHSKSHHVPRKHRSVPHVAHNRVRVHRDRHLSHPPSQVQSSSVLDRRHSRMRSRDGRRCRLTGRASHHTGSTSLSRILKRSEARYPTRLYSTARLPISLLLAPISFTPWWSSNVCVRAARGSFNDGSSRRGQRLSAAKRRSDRRRGSSSLSVTLGKRHLPNEQKLKRLLQSLGEKSRRCVASSQSPKTKLDVRGKSSAGGIRKLWTRPMI